MQLNEKRRRMAIIHHSKDLKEIWAMYYSVEKLRNKIRDKPVEFVYYTYNVEEILRKFNIRTIAELIFLLHRHGGEIIKQCEFCEKQITRLKIRTSVSLDDCRCKGVCTVCKKTYTSANHDGVCYNCRPWNDNDDERGDFDSVRYRFLRATANHDHIMDIASISGFQQMMDMASYYYHLFKDKRNELIEGHGYDVDEYLKAKE